MLIPISRNAKFQDAAEGDTANPLSARERAAPAAPGAGLVSCSQGSGLGGA